MLRPSLPLACSALHRPPTALLLRLLCDELAPAATATRIAQRRGEERRGEERRATRMASSLAMAMRRAAGERGRLWRVVGASCWSWEGRPGPCSSRSFRASLATSADSSSSASRSKQSTAASRASALAVAVRAVETAFGKGSIMNLGDRSALMGVEVISTGSMGLDIALGVGGLPRGRIVEIYGPEASGKTTVALQCVAQCQRAGGTAVFVDAEHALDAAYCERLGVDLNSLLVSQPDHGEQALGIVETLVQSGTVDMVVVDSVAALVPKAELEGDMGDSHIALQARLMSQALRKLTASLSKARCLIIFVNQIRSKVGVIFGSPEVTSGGNALRFYASVRLEVRRGQVIKHDGEASGTTCRVKVAKNKLAPPFRTAEFDILYGSGVDREGELLDLSVEAGLVRRSGAWYSTAIGCPSLGEEYKLGQGREKARAYLKQNPTVARELEQQTMEVLRGPKKVEAGDDVPTEAVLVSNDS